MTVVIDTGVRPMGLSTSYEVLMTKDKVPYPELERIERLQNNGRELLGKIIYWTEKRDGSNVAVWLSYDKLHTPPDGLGEEAFHKARTKDDQTLNVIVSSRNQDCAEWSLVKLLRETKEYNKVLDLLTDNPYFVVFGELIPRGRGPTRIEPVHKKPSFVIFDIYDKEFASFEKRPDNGAVTNLAQLPHGRFLAYPAMYQHCYHYKLPVVQLLGITRHTYLHETVEEQDLLSKHKYESLFSEHSGFRESALKENMDLCSYEGYSVYYIKDQLLKWCRRHKREGIVGKAFDGLETLYFKEKIDLPSGKILKAIDKGQSLQIPPLPDSEVLGAIDKAWQQLGDEKFKDKTLAMPLISQLVKVECKKHLCNLPKGKNLFSYYLDYCGGKFNA